MYQPVCKYPPRARQFRGRRLSVPLWRIQYPYTIFLMKTPESLVIHLFSPLSPPQQSKQTQLSLCTRDQIEKSALFFYPWRMICQKNLLRSSFLLNMKGEMLRSWFYLHTTIFHVCVFRTNNESINCISIGISMVVVIKFVVLDFCITL